MVDEGLRCNVCGVVVSAEHANHHIATSSHESYKSELEQQLNAIKRESYKNDSSVIGQWQDSL